MNEPFIPSLELCDSLVEGFGPSICNRGAVLQDEMDRETISTAHSKEAETLLKNSEQRMHFRMFTMVARLPTALFALLLLCSMNFAATVVTDGNITYDGNYTVVTFRSNGTFNVTGTINATVLLIAGGGGGGEWNSGGGGAGGPQRLPGGGRIRRRRAFRPEGSPL